MGYIQKFSVKQIVARRCNSRVIPREMKEGDMVLKHVVVPTKFRKLLFDWEGPYKVCEKLSHGIYRLEELNNNDVPRSWNSVNMRYYYS